MAVQYVRYGYICVRDFFQLLDDCCKTGTGDYGGGCVSENVQHEQSVKTINPNQHCVELFTQCNFIQFYSGRCVFNNGFLGHIDYIWGVISICELVVV